MPASNVWTRGIDVAEAKNPAFRQLYERHLKEGTYHNGGLNRFHHGAIQLTPQGQLLPGTTVELVNQFLHKFEGELITVAGPTVEVLQPDRTVEQRNFGIRQLLCNHTVGSPQLSTFQ